MKKKIGKHKTNKGEIKIIDATGPSVGRLASQIVLILTGKNKADFSPELLSNVKVVVENVSKVKFTGKKLDQKEYIHSSGYPGGLKRTKMREVFKKNPAEVLRKAVWNMLPQNKLRKQRIKKLEIK